MSTQNTEKDAKRYQFLVTFFGQTKLPVMLEEMFGLEYVEDGKESIDRVIDGLQGEQQ